MADKPKQVCKWIYKDTVMINVDGQLQEIMSMKHCYRN
jgi:hypothetical protein